MLLKYTLKNIFSKPGRLLIIMICMTAACFSGYLAADFGNSFKGLIYNMLGGIVGNADYLVNCTSSDGITPELFEGLPDCEFVSMKTLSKREIRRDERQYSYAITDNVTVYSFNSMESAYAIGIIPADVDPGDGEIAIGKEYSKVFGYHEGDIITLNDTEYNPHPFTVKSIYSDTQALESKYTAVISAESYASLMGDVPFYSANVNVLSDDQRAEFKEQMTKTHPNVTLYQVYMSEETDKIFDQFTAMLYLAFVLVFVLVVFVTVSFTEKIITERMSVIGTLRSIGMSMRKTTAILLLENVLYGLAGSLLGLVLYLVVRKLALDFFSDSFSMQTTDVALNYALIPLVILGSVLIQVLVPLKEVLKAVRTSIRDIIFENRDSEYKLSYPKTAAGAGCIALGLILGFATKNLFLSSTAILLIIVGSALSIQFVVRTLTLLLSSVFRKHSMPVAELAAFESGSKKPNSGNAVLTVAAVAAAAAIFVMLSSILNAFERTQFDSDLIISDASLKTTKYSYLEETEGVSEIEYIYSVSDTIQSSGHVKQYPMSILSIPATGQYKVLGDLPTDLGKNEAVLDRPAANKLHLQAGDTIDITFHADGIFTIQKSLTIRAVTQETEFGSIGKIVLANELYRELFPDNVSMILLRADDPAAVKNTIAPTFTGGEEVKTMQEYNDDIKESNGKIVAGMIVVIAAAVLLTLIGISGNQLIGFAARKKEYAMLHSCACSRSKIIRMILIENALLFGISCIAAGLICIPVSTLIARILSMTDLGIYVDVRYNTLFICIFILWLITMLTALSPIKSLNRMNTAMELKYE